MSIAPKENFEQKTQGFWLASAENGLGYIMSFAEWEARLKSALLSTFGPAFRVSLSRAHAQDYWLVLSTPEKPFIAGIYFRLMCERQDFCLHLNDMFAIGALPLGFMLELSKVLGHSLGFDSGVGSPVISLFEWRQNLSKLGSVGAEFKLLPSVGGDLQIKLKEHKWEQDSELSLAILEDRELRGLWVDLDAQLLASPKEKSTRFLLQALESEAHNIFILRRLWLFDQTLFTKVDLSLIKRLANDDEYPLIWYSALYQVYSARSEVQGALKALSQWGRKFWAAFEDWERHSDLELIMAELLGDAWVLVDPSKARDSYESCLKIAPQNARILTKIWHLLRQGGDVEAEILLLKKLKNLEQRPEACAAIFLRLAELLEVDDPQLAAKFAAQAREHSHEDSQLNIKTVDLYIQAQQPKEALKIISDAIEAKTWKPEERIRLELKSAEIWQFHLNRQDLAKLRLERSLEQWKAHKVETNTLLAAFSRHRWELGLREIYAELIRMAKRPQDLSTLLKSQFQPTEAQSFYDLSLSIHRDKLKVSPEWEAWLGDYAKVYLKDRVRAGGHYSAAFDLGYERDEYYPFMLEYFRAEGNELRIVGLIEKKLEQAPLAEQVELLLYLLSDELGLGQRQREIYALKLYSLSPDYSKVPEELLIKYLSQLKWERVDHLLKELVQASSDALSQAKWYRLVLNQLSDDDSPELEPKLEEYFRAWSQFNEDFFEVWSLAQKCLSSRPNLCQPYLVLGLRQGLLPDISEAQVTLALKGEPIHLGRYFLLKAQTELSPELKKAAIGNMLATLEDLHSEEREALEWQGLDLLASLGELADASLDRWLSLGEKLNYHEALAQHVALYVQKSGSQAQIRLKMLGYAQGYLEPLKAYEQSLECLGFVEIWELEEELKPILAWLCAYPGSKTGLKNLINQQLEIMVKNLQATKCFRWTQFLLEQKSLSREYILTLVPLCQQLASIAPFTGIFEQFVVGEQDTLEWESFLDRFYQAFKLGIRTQAWLDIQKGLVQRLDSSDWHPVVKFEWALHFAKNLQNEALWPEGAMRLLAWAHAVSPKDFRVIWPYYQILRLHRQHAECISLLEGILTEVSLNPSILATTPYTLDSLKDDFWKLKAGQILAMTNPRDHSQKPQPEFRDRRLRLPEGAVEINLELGKVWQVPTDAEQTLTVLLAPEAEVAPQESEILESLKDMPDWRDYCLKLRAEPTKAAECVYARADTPEERHMAVQAVALLAGELDVLQNWRSQVWRRPEDYFYPLEVGKRLRGLSFSHPLLPIFEQWGSALANILRESFPQKADLKALSFSLGIGHTDFSQLRSPFDWEGDFAQKTGLSLFASRFRDRNIKVYQCRGLKKRIFFDIVQQELDIDIFYYERCPPTHALHRLLFWEKVANSPLRFFYAYKLEEEIWPLMEHLPDLIAGRVVMDGESPGLRVALEALRGAPGALADIEQLRAAGQEGLNDFAEALKKSVLEIQLAETLDLVGLIEAEANCDLLRRDWEPGAIAQSSPAAGELFLSAAKLVFDF